MFAFLVRFFYTLRICWRKAYQILIYLCKRKSITKIYKIILLRGQIWYWESFEKAKVSRFCVENKIAKYQMIVSSDKSNVYILVIIYSFHCLGLQAYSNYWPTVFSWEFVKLLVKGDRGSKTRRCILMLSPCYKWLRNKDITTTYTLQTR